MIVGSSPPRPYAMGPGIAPALSGPTVRMPAAFTRAIDPPPAPMVWMSIIGTRTGRPYPISLSAVTAGRPSRITPTSKLVPPMSQLITFRCPARRATWAAAFTPAAGPDIRVLTA